MKIYLYIVERERIIQICPHIEFGYKVTNKWAQYKMKVETFSFLLSNESNLGEANVTNKWAQYKMKVEHFHFYCRTKVTVGSAVGNTHSIRAKRNGVSTWSIRRFKKGGKFTQLSYQWRLLYHPSLPHCYHHHKRCRGCQHLQLSCSM